MRINKKNLTCALVLILLTALSCTKADRKMPAAEGDLFTYVDSTGAVKPVGDRAGWKHGREQTLRGMEQAMGKLPSHTGLPAFDPEIADSMKGNSYTRYTIRLTVANNEKLPAYLYVPIRKNKNRKLPAMLALHPTGDAGKKLVDGENKLPNRAYAKELAERGYVVIAPDYPGMGELIDYDFANDRYQSGTMKAIFDHIRCVDFLQSLDYVDPERIGVIGHSLGGHNSMFVGAFDTRLKVIVSSCGWTLMDYYNIGEEASKRYGGRLGPWAQDRYMPLMRDRFHLDQGKIPFDFDGIIAALAPRAFFSNSPLNDSNFAVEGVRKGIESASKVYKLFDAENKIVVRYPSAEHDFPDDVRFEAYRFIDNCLQHTPAGSE